jgi:hypothetical protein
VGQTVTWHIEISSHRDAPSTQLQVILPDGVELVEGDATWQGDIKAGQDVSIDLMIRVNQPGDDTIDAYAFARTGPDSGFGNGKQVCIVSTLESITAGDCPTPMPPPVLMIDSGTSSPLMTITPSP